MILLLMPFFVLAINITNIPQPVNNNTPLVPSVIIGYVVDYLVWPIAVAAIVIMFIIAGIKFLTAQGEPAQLQSARSAFAWGVVGVIVVLVGFSIIATVKWLLGIA